MPVDRGLSNINKVLEPGTFVIRDKRTGQQFTLSYAKTRITRLRRRVFAWAKTLNTLDRHKNRTVMLTLTYARVEDWQKNQIREFMLIVRKHLKDGLLAYAWVAELQQRGAVHYHVLLVVRKGSKIPQPDRAGWWPWGLTRTETAKTPFYIAKYTGKEYQKVGPFPKGLRIFAVWLSDDLVSGQEYWYFRLSSLPGWFREVILSLPISRHFGDWKRAPGGGWEYEGRCFESPYELLDR